MHRDNREPERWNPEHLPDQSGKTMVVTGGSSGIGYFIAEQLASAGATVVIAARNRERSAAATTAISRRHPRADLRILPLDIAAFSSIQKFGDELASLGRVDALILNAATMRIPHAGATTADGFDLIMGTGHLGNAALIAHSLPVLDQNPGSRIVGTTSGLVRWLRRDLPGLESVSTPLPAVGAIAIGRRYVLSKAAHEAFLFELDRRLRAAGSTTSALLSHPGMAVDSRSPERIGVTAHRRGQRWREPLFGMVGASKDAAAQSAVRAATDPHAQGGEYYGPAGRIGGPPQLGSPSARFRDHAVGTRIWHETQELLGIESPLPAPR